MVLFTLLLPGNMLLMDTVDGFISQWRIMNPQDHQQTSHKLHVVTEENLHDQNERLLARVGHLESRLGHLAGSNTDLSCRLVQSEEEKLKISKELVEEKIQTSKIREQFEEEMFELKNEILNRDGAISELEMERDRLLRELQAAEARLKVGEKSGQDLTEEYAALRTKHRALAEAHNKAVYQSEELSAELLALAQAQDALRRQLREQQHNVKTTTQGLYGELDRVRTLISRMSHNRVKPEDLAALDKEQKTMEKTLLGNQDGLKDTLEKMKNGCEAQQKRLEEKVVALVKEHQENRRQICNSQHKLSEKSAALMCSWSQIKEGEEENSRLQLQLKKLNEEYRSRLVRYLQDLADYADRPQGETLSGGTQMRAFVESMLQDVRSSYRAREEQLTAAARSYKKRLQKTTEAHHALLIAYRVQREQILAQSDGGQSPGPPEAHFSLDPSELRAEHERELQRLRQDKARLEGQLHAAQQQVCVCSMPRQNESENVEPLRLWSGDDFWMEIRNQLKEITDSTLVGFEREHVRLVTRATVAEAQVLELQDYVDSHLYRYKQEITHLRRLRGKEDTSDRPRSAL